MSNPANMLYGEVKRRKKELSKAVYATSHLIWLDEARHVYQNGAEWVIVGTGQRGLIELSEDAAVHFWRKGCIVGQLPTPEALDAWNRAEGTVLGLFQVTY